jgi:hypothetical protein
MQPILNALDSAIAHAKVQIAAREPGIAEGAPGFYLEFDLPVDHQQAIDSLENRKKAIELVAVKPPQEGDETVSATVFVPETAQTSLKNVLKSTETRTTQEREPQGIKT